MPEVQENETEQEWIRRCMPAVMGDGSANDGAQAYAMCMGMWHEAQGTADGKAAGGDWVMALSGSAVKALGDGKVGGHLIRFGSPSDLDAEGDYFDEQTEYGPHKTTMVYYHHGDDGKLARKMLDQEARLGLDDVGIWIQAQLDMREEYERAIYAMAEAGKLGWSSGTAGHLMEYEQIGKAWHITSWPLGLDASMTPTPAEYRNTVLPLKAYLKGVAGALRDMGDLRAEQGQEGAERAPVQQADGEPDERATHKTDPAPRSAPARTKTTEDNTMSEETKDLITAEQAEIILRDNAEIKGTLGKQAGMLNQIVAALERSPGAKDAGYVAPDSETDHEGVKTFGDFLIAVARKNERRLVKVYKSTKAALSGEAGETGGYTVPEVFLPRLLQVATEEQVIEPGAFVLPMSSDVIKIPRLDLSGTTSGQAHTLGGVVAYWTGEGAALTETEPTFEQMELHARKLGGYTLASNELTQDNAISLEALLARLFGLAIGWHRDRAFLRGDGVAKPKGILNAACKIQVTENAANVFKLVDAATMLEKLPGSSFDRAMWVMHQTLITQLVQMVDAGSNSVWMANVGDKPRWYLFGLPIKFTEKIPALGTTGACVLVDRSYYVIGNRGGISIAASEHYKFINDQMTWRFTDRVDGQPWLSSVITLEDGTTTVSPIVELLSA